MLEGTPGRRTTFGAACTAGVVAGTCVAGAAAAVAGSGFVRDVPPLSEPPRTPERTTIRSAKAATSATRTISTTRGIRLVVAAMVFTGSLSAEEAVTLI